MHGLLRAGFVPPADIRRLQDYLRLRADHVTSSLAGISGLAVVRAIVAGERSAESRWRCATSRSAAPRPSRSSNRCVGPGAPSISLR